MKKIFLPKLVRIEVENFSLYSQQPSFSYDFKSGINAIIGVNGIGKTTFIELIIYCLVGYKREYKLNKRKNEMAFVKKNQNYFSSRFNNNFEKNEEAKATLTFNINDEEMKICRSLFVDEIIYVTLNGENLHILDEEDYIKLILEKLRFSDFAALQKIIREFLVFDEQRLNVAWEMENQDEVLRILLLDEKPYELFNQLETEIIYLDSKGRHLSEDRRVARERLEVLQSERDKLLEKVKNEAEAAEDNIKSEDNFNYNELISLKNTLSMDVASIEDEIEKLLSLIENETYDINKFIGERNLLNQELEDIDNYISKEENKLYSSVYDKLPDYYFTLEKSLINDGKCLACSSRNNDFKERYKNRKLHHECLVCGSELTEEFEFNPEIIDNLNSYSLKRDNLKVNIKNKQNEIDKIKEKHSNLNNELNLLLKEKDLNVNKLVQIESLIAQSKKNIPTDTYSQLVLNLDNQINELTNEVNEVYKERDILKLKLEQLQNKFVSDISKINKELSFYFNKYASTFLGIECELTMKRQKIRSIPHVQFMPKLNGAERSDIYSVSESQRFFVDQAFRMAIIDFLQNNIEGFEVFFITETPEGSLDIAYEEQVAEMFTIFAESNNNIIFTSNLNSSNFLGKIFNRLDKNTKKDRVLNMLEKGNLTKVHKAYKEILVEKLSILFGDE